MASFFGREKKPTNSEGVSDAAKAYRIPDGKDLATPSSQQSALPIAIGSNTGSEIVRDSSSLY